MISGKTNSVAPILSCGQSLTCELILHQEKFSGKNFVSNFDRDLVDSCAFGLEESFFIVCSMPIQDHRSATKKK